MPQPASKVYKVHHTLNTTADSLARQALQASTQDNHMVQFSCSSENHVPSVTSYKLYNM